MNKNILYCTLGIIAGFFLGFFVANTTGGIGVRTTADAPAAASNPEPRPLKPSETELPPDHPSIDGTTGADSSNAASSSAAQTARENAERNPRDFDAQMSAAASFYQLRQYDKAIPFLERALALRPDDPDALVAMGNARYDTRDFKGAATFYERALVLQPDNADVRTDLGNTYFQRDPPDYRRAIAEYRKSVASDPKHEKSWQNIAAAAVRLRDKATAREAVERLAAINAQSPSLSSLRQSIEALP